MTLRRVIIAKCFWLIIQPDIFHKKYDKHFEIKAIWVEFANVYLQSNNKKRFAFMSATKAVT